MARQAKVWLRKQNRWFYTTVNGEQVKLSQDRREAQRLFRELKARQPERETAVVSPTFRFVADKWLDDSQRTKAPNTYRMGVFYLQAFCDWVKKRKVVDLRVKDVTEWLATKDTWNSGTRCGARTTILACLNWAVDQGYVAENPLKKVKRGRHNRRERIFTVDELRRVREFTNPLFRDFLLGLELTGARPFSELARVEASMVNWDESTVTLHEHKNARKTGKSRTIYLVPDMVLLLKKLALRHPTGPLFRNTRGKAWTSHDATRRLHYCTAKLGIERGTVYGIRHQVATQALEKGLSANVVAELLGNSPVTLTRYYDHLSSKRQTMLDAAKKAVG